MNLYLLSMFLYEIGNFFLKELTYDRLKSMYANVNENISNWMVFVINEVND